MMNETTDSPSDEDEPGAASPATQNTNLINFGDEHNMAPSSDWDLQKVRRQINDMANEHLLKQLDEIPSLIIAQQAATTVEIRDQHMGQHKEHRQRNKYEIDQPVDFSSSKSTSGCFAFCRGIRDHSGTFLIRDSLTSHC